MTNNECSICRCPDDLTAIRGVLYCDECAALAAFPGYLYLASPYTHADAEVRQLRFDAVCKAAASLMASGRVVFAPIAHSHPIHLHGLNATDHEFWKAQDRPFLENCDSLGVLMLAGWDTSPGVDHEIQTALDAGKQIIYLDPSDFDIKE